MTVVADISGAFGQAEAVLFDMISEGEIQAARCKRNCCTAQGTGRSSLGPRTLHSLKSALIRRPRHLEPPPSPPSDRLGSWGGQARIDQRTGNVSFEDAEDLDMDMMQTLEAKGGASSLSLFSIKAPKVEKKRNY